MNKLHGILLGTILLSGTIMPSFAQSQSDFLTLFDILKEKKQRPDVRSFSAAAIILTSSTTGGTIEKITLCHIPPGNPGKAHTISVASPAVFAHLSHGDYLGDCNTASDDTIKSDKSKENKNKKPNHGKGKH